MKPTKEEARKKFRELPETLQDIILSFEKVEATQSIGRKYHLHIDQIGYLANEINYIILGFTKPYELTDNIKKALNVPYDIAQEIVRDVDEQILKKIRGELQAVYSPEHAVSTGGQEKITDNQPKEVGVGEEKSEPVTIQNTSVPQEVKPRDIFAEKTTGLTSHKKEELEINLNEPEKKSEAKIGDTTIKTAPRHDPYKEPTE